MQIQWYPGHMTKARRMLAENLKVADVVVSLLDARIPRSSWNPDVTSMLRDKSRLVILNKADLADAQATAGWQRYFRAQGVECLAVTSVKKGERKQVLQAVERAARQRVEAMRARGVRKVVRVMVVGIPNVGKSTLINMLAGQVSARAEDRPGVTRGRQWVRIGPSLELMDTPGMLWPKFEDAQTGLHLAFCGCVRDEIVDTEKLCLLLLDTLRRIAPQALLARYKLETLEGLDAEALLEQICRRRGFINRGDTCDLQRGVRTILDEFRGGRIGRMTLEMPDEEGRA